MAQASLIPKNGAVTIGSGTNGGVLADFNSFTIRTSQAVDNVTPYGANNHTKNVGSGTPDWDVNVTAFALKGASTTSPQLDTLESAGITCTFTADSTTCSYTGTFIVASKELVHSRMRGAVGFNMTLKNAGDITEAWLES